MNDSQQGRNYIINAEYLRGIIHNIYDKITMITKASCIKYESHVSLISPSLQHDAPTNKIYIQTLKHAQIYILIHEPQTLKHAQTKYIIHTNSQTRANSNMHTNTLTTNSETCANKIYTRICTQTLMQTDMHTHI